MKVYVVIAGNHNSPVLALEVHTDEEKAKKGVEELKPLFPTQVPKYFEVEIIE